MAKKLIAVTNIKLGSGPDEYFAAGTEVDASKFTKAQLAELHDNGAIQIEDSTSVKDIQDSVTEKADAEQAQSQAQAPVVMAPTVTTTTKPATTSTSTTTAATPAATPAEESKK